MFRFPSLFFFFNEGKLLGFDTQSQSYYQVDQHSFDQLRELSTVLLPIKDEFSPSPLPLKSVYSNLEWGGDVPSHIAHQTSRILSHNTEILSSEQFVTQYSQISEQAKLVPEKEFGDDTKTIPLPVLDLSQFDNTSLKSCLINRKTCRDFIEQNIKLEQVSNLLYACFGKIHGDKNSELEELGLKDFGQRRSSPSATGLASCDAVLWAKNVENLDEGMYHYNSDVHQLHNLSSSMSSDDLVFSMLDQFWCRDLAAGIFIVNDLRRTWVKDIKCRGYLASHQEAGHISQNILLCATALNLKTWISGTFRDDFLQEKLQLPDYKFVSLFIGLGHGSGKPISQEYIRLMP